MVHHSMMSCYTAIIDYGVGEYGMTWKGFTVYFCDLSSTY